MKGSFRQEIQGYVRVSWSFKFPVSVDWCCEILDVYQVEPQKQGSFLLGMQPAADSVGLTLDLNM